MTTVEHNEHRHCCFIDPTTNMCCTAPAEYEIWTPPDPYDLTDACTRHIGELLDDTPEHRVYLLVDSTTGIPILREHQ